MKVLSFFVAILSGVSIALGVVFILLGLWSVLFSDGGLIMETQPNWGPNDYAVWGLVLTIVGYLGLLRSRSEASTHG